MLKIIVTICAVIGTVLTILQAYKAVYFIIGLFTYKKYKPTENKHRYGICIAARNEEKVIKNLLESIEQQDYPLDKLTVFVCVNNCTDNTKQFIEDYKKTSKLDICIYERNNPEEKTKGFALKYMFNEIKKDYGIETYDAYFIFDADNVLQNDYFSRMNEAFDAGNELVVSLRHTKNFSQNWISFSYAIHWLRTCLNENRGKSVISHASCRIQGTGVMFTNKLVLNGWNYTTLTEDRSFCTDAVVQGYKIGYCEKAVFYDEQPYKLKVALRQRIRWAKGHLQSTVENEPKLVKTLFKKKDSFVAKYDFFWVNFPTAIESCARRIVRETCNMIIAIMACTFLGFVKGIVVSYFINLATMWLENMGIAILTLIYYKKQIGKLPFWKSVFGVFMFPFFEIIGKWSMYIALFKKVEWKPIPHDQVVDVSNLKAQ